MDRINDAELLSRLRDMNREFSENELNNIIQNQFFNDNVALVDDVVDAALIRLLLLEGETPDQDKLQKRRTALMTDIFKKVLVPKNKKDGMP